MRRALLLVAAALALAACTRPAESGDAPPPASAVEAAQSPSLTTEAKARGPVIATIVTQQAKVSVLGNGGTGDSLRVIVRKTDGQLVADGITVAELERVDPLLAVLVQNAVASNGTYMDATLDRPRTPIHAGF